MSKVITGMCSSIIACAIRCLKWFERTKMAYVSLGRYVSDAMTVRPDSVRGAGVDRLVLLNQLRVVSAEDNSPAGRKSNGKWAHISRRAL